MTGIDLKAFSPNLTILWIKKGWASELQLFLLVGMGDLGSPGPTCPTGVMLWVSKPPPESSETPMKRNLFGDLWKSNLQTQPRWFLWVSELSSPALRVPLQLKEKQLGLWRFRPWCYPNCEEKWVEEPALNTAILSALLLTKHFRSFTRPLKLPAATRLGWPGTS